MSAQPEFQQRAILSSTPTGRTPAAGHSPQAIEGPAPKVATPAESAPDAAILPPTPNLAASRRVADHLVALHADTLDDVERMRIALANRLRALTDDSQWGKGVNPLLPEVTVLRAHLTQVEALEHGATLALKRAVRRHYLHGWIKGTVGVGEKQAARLLAMIGDPATRDRPSQLWAYCGLHVLHPGHHSPDAHSPGAGVDPSTGSQPMSVTQASLAAGSHPTDHRPNDTQRPVVGGVAPKRQRGQPGNWSTLAKMRVYLIAESCIKQRTSPYRPVYEEGRVKYAEAVHGQPCPRCGPKGNPAQPGSPLSDGHKHARAMRLVMKRILLDMWREATT